MDVRQLIADLFGDGVGLPGGFTLRVRSYPARIKLPPGTSIEGPIGLMRVDVDALDISPGEVRIVVDGLPDMRISL